MRNGARGIRKVILVAVLFLIAVIAGYLLLMFMLYRDQMLLGAARSGNYGKTRLLLFFGADVNAPSRRGTPLLWAEAGGHKEIVRLLLARGANFEKDLQNWGATALVYSAMDGSIHMVRFLVSKGVNVNSSDKGTGTALECAVREGHKEIVGYLIANGADLNPTVLHQAVMRGHNGIAELLIANDAGINVRDGTGRTPLDYATTEDMRAMLRKHGGRSGKEVQ